MVHWYPKMGVVKESRRGQLKIFPRASARISTYTSAPPPENIFLCPCNVVPEVPRIASRQCHRDNVEHASTEEYYCRTIIYPFLDNLIAQMHEHFGNTQIIASKLINLVPSVICNVNDVSFDDLICFYNDDLPNPSVVATEILRWKAKWERQGAEDRPESLATAIQQCDKDFFPNIYALLHFGCTVPVTSSENERANSVLKNLKSFLRSTQGQER